MTQLSVIIPVFNEQANILTMYQRLQKVTEQLQVKAEYLFVNDGSRDHSMQVIKGLATSDERVKYIDFSRNFGHQVAVSAGLDACTGEAIVIIDADLQDPPELIIDLYKKMQEGYAVVYAKRRSRTGEGFMKKFTAKLFYRILSRITNIEIPVDAGDYRIISRQVADILNQMPEQHKYLRGQIAWVGFNQSFVEYDRQERHAGQTGYTYRKMIRFALDGITSFSRFPLKVATIAGFVVSGITFLLMIYTLYSRLILKNYEPGWASLMMTILFIGGVQLIGIGIIGEYIGRMSDNVRGRPLYIVKESNIDKK
ncbi:MAG: glycosyltransferase family 2 protein [Bacteroidia bacterium]|nr:glycosyltransferase family 2 protein [Bacteroidia bacterium]